MISILNSSKLRVKMSNYTQPIVAIIGRMNVGKSTLFNKITGARRAIVHHEPGITRDRIYAEVGWKGHPFMLVDTGGIESLSQEEIQKKIIKQTEIAIEEADLILLLVDLKAGINPDDLEIAKTIREKNKPVILVANKADIKESELKLYEFYELGLGDPFIISAEQGLRVDSLLDKIVSFTSPLEVKAEKEEEEVIRVSILGKPNVGKSSLLNCLLGEDRIITSEQPGTTRDTIEVVFKQDSFKAIFVDTAGLKNKAKLQGEIEYYSTLRAQRAVKNSDLALLVLDSTQGVSVQDKKIANYIKQEKKGYIIILNKFDLIEREVDQNLLIEEVKYELSFLSNSPLMLTSALTGYNVDKIIFKIKEVAEQYNRKIPTPALNAFIREVVAQNPPKQEKGRRLKINYITQVGTKPPTFLLLVNNPQLMYESYYRYLENKLYETFGLEGSPLVLNLEKRDKRKRSREL